MVKTLQTEITTLKTIITFKKKDVHTKINDLTTRMTAMETKTSPWTLTRTTYQFPTMKMMTFTTDTMTTTTQTIPTDVLPTNTRAVLVAVKCEKWNEQFTATLTMKMKQTGNTEGGTVVYTAPMNDFYYETFMPWDMEGTQTMTMKTTGTSKNTYTVTIVGYVTQ